MYRIYSTGTAIECDSPEDVQALLSVMSLRPRVVDAPPLPKAPRTPSPKASAVKPAPKAIAADSTEATERRALLLTLIRKAEVGLTLGELRKATAKMDGKDRSNALQQLKASGEIRRTGNTWATA